MNHPNQLRNLIEFTALFLSGDLVLTKESGDYIKEKYDKYIGFPIKTNAETTNLYTEWRKIWGDSDDINSIFLYLITLYTIYRNKNKLKDSNKHWLTYITADELLDTFIKYIGETDNIKKTRYSHIHPLIQKNIIDDYVSKNERLFKLLRILND